jgi:hypothetical protein
MNLLGLALFNAPLICFAAGAAIGYLFPRIYRNNLKNRDVGQEPLRRFDPERAAIPRGKLPPPKTESSGRFGIGVRLPKWGEQGITLYLLFAIGVKGGASLLLLDGVAHLFIGALAALVIWGVLQPLLSFYLLRLSTHLDVATAAAVAASFGSVSVMTFASALSFLEQLNCPYQEWVIPLLAIMELPAIIAGVYLARTFEKREGEPLAQIVKESLLNKAICAIGVGLLAGAWLTWQQIGASLVLTPFTPLLCLFMLAMGRKVGMRCSALKTFSWTLHCFGIYMPLLGGAVGLLIGWSLALDVGTATLLAVLAASASYIAVPAAMRLALPHAQEAVYLPLSLGVAFPFNVLIGIPLYFYLAMWLKGLSQ